MTDVICSAGVNEFLTRALALRIFIAGLLTFLVLFEDHVSFIRLQMKPTNWMNINKSKE